MAKPKTLEQLRAEKERAETQLAQEQHKLERLENRKKYLEKGERTKRTHRLCNLGGTVESLAPEIKDLTRTEMTELMEHIFSLSEVQRAVRHMAITHIKQANREKELKAKVDMKKLSDEYDELEQAHETTYGEFKAVRDDLHRLWKVKSCVDTAARFNERTEEQKLQNRPQTRQKKEELSR